MPKRDSILAAFGNVRQRRETRELNGQPCIKPTYFHKQSYNLNLTYFYASV
jgi:hypothetical protein